MPYARIAYLVAVSLLLLSFTASAGTVVLTGTCIAPPANSSTLAFSIANSGNDSATQMVINPTVFGANVSLHSISIGQLSPGANYTVEINITNVSAPGMHAAYYTAVYQQGSSIFSTVFPCLVPVHTATNSSLELTTNSSVSGSGTETVNVTVYNAGSPVTARVFLALSPLFRYIGPDFYNVSLAQYESRNLTFKFSVPASLTLSYSAGAFATYTYDNKSYGSMSTFSIAAEGQPPAKTASQGTFSLLLYGMVVVIVAVVALLVFAIARRSLRHKRAKPQV